ncbi:MAG: RNA chaperone Hfq [Acidobacteria bacterium]|nr:RNA chaperone Hfq [Acidobacteriota bacterium]
MTTHKTRAPDQTLAENKYLRSLIERRTPVRVRLSDDQEVGGTIEFFDESFIRLTRENAPNLFIYKHDIKYLYETEA